MAIKKVIHKHKYRFARKLKLYVCGCGKSITEKPKIEKDIQRECCDYLESKNYFFWRQNTLPIYNFALKRFRAMPKHAKKGVPDIILLKKGTVVFFEVKRPKGVLSEAQIDFQINCIRLGIDYHMITSKQDLIDLGF